MLKDTTNIQFNCLFHMLANRAYGKYICMLYSGLNVMMTIQVVALFKARDCGRSLAGIANLNLAGGMDVCLL